MPRSVTDSLDLYAWIFLSTLSSCPATVFSLSSMNLIVFFAIWFLSSIPAILYTSNNLFSILMPFSGTGVSIPRSITVELYESGVAFRLLIMTPAAPGTELKSTKKFFPVI